MGGSPQGASDHYAEGNPIALLPVEADERLIASVVLDPAQAEAFRRAAEAKGQAVSITVLKDAGHFDMMSPQEGKRAFRSKRSSLALWGCTARTADTLALSLRQNAKPSHEV
jgi:uncharacterized protein GlcG (DUF336 family)